MKRNAKLVINLLYTAGHKIIINTCRADQYAAAAYSWLVDNGIKFHVFNENLPELIELYGSDTRKLSGDVYIDDKNLGGIPDDWLHIYQMVLYPLQYEFLRTATQTQKSHLEAIITERTQQDLKHPNKGLSVADYLAVLVEEVGEVAKEINQMKESGEPLSDNYRVELIQVAATALRMLEETV